MPLTAPTTTRSSGVRPCITARKAPSRGVALGLTVGFLGITMVAWPHLEAGGSDLVGVLLVLAASVSYGFALNVARPLQIRHGALPENMPEVTLHATAGGMPIAQLAKQAGLVESTSEALRLIAQRGLKLDGEVVADKALVVPSGTTVVVQAGKRKFARVTIK